MTEKASRAGVGKVVLRHVVRADFPIFFEQQRDPIANKMANFPPRDRDAFDAHWTKILADREVHKKSILFNEALVGNVVCWEERGRRLVGYWIGREFWGRGIASRALAGFLQHVQIRPLYAYVAIHNAGSIRVLEKCGFGITDGVDEPSESGEKAADDAVFVLS